MKKKKTYCVLKECFYIEPERKPYFEAVKTEFDCLERAQTVAEKLCDAEAESFNRSKTEGGLCFSSGEAGDERFDYWTLAWDGDDYRVVTGYIIVEIPQRSCERTKKDAL